MKCVLVCGGRNFEEWDLFCDIMNQITSNFKEYKIIHGGARGADTMADYYGKKVACVPVESYPADWNTHGKKAGPIRNERMLKEGKPDLVVAFPGGAGTSNMMKIAVDAGVKVIDVQKTLYQLTGEMFF